MPAKITASSTLTSGPAAAIRNSVRPSRGSLASRATPPKMNRVMDSMAIPLRMATREWPSSCRRTDAKNSSDAAMPRAQ